MSLLEFDVIQKYFSKITNTNNSANIPLAIGDDAAIVSLPEKKELVICTDTLNDGIHFPIDTSAYNIGYKALAVNLSDIAAMGATPKWFTLNVSLPNINTTWLQDFTKGLADLSAQYKLDLIGGDTTRGPLSITITLAGHISKGQALTRSRADIGDKVYLSGCTGDAAIGLATSLNNVIVDTPDDYFVNRLNRPTARVELGLSLVGIANACIDISDGLLADSLHIANASQCGIQLNLDSIPLPKISNRVQARQYALSGGDDYELIFTVPKNKQQVLDNIIEKSELTITCIGEVVEKKGIEVLDQNKKSIQLSIFGYEHFKQ